jgi:hypothetical protein
MVMNLKKLLLILLLLALAPYPSAAAEAPLMPAAGVLHLHTTVGAGSLPPEEVVRKVEEAGLKIVMFSDKDANKIEYGLFPFRNLLKKTEERMSINRYGAGRYIDRFKAIAAQHPGMVILPGTESSTFYYWEGSILKSLLDGSLFSGQSGLTVRDWHKNILVYGLDKPDDYKNLPSVPNKKPRSFTFVSMLKLWPLLLILLGLKRLFYRTSYAFSLAVNSAQKEKRKLRVSSLIALGMGAALLIANFPFSAPKFDQYHGNQGSAPYQELIDYVNARGGLTFWSSPDVTTANFVLGPVTFKTAPYYHELLATRDYTGFAIFVEGMKNSGIPGGVWDQVLTEYVNGKRAKPVWAIGEMDYEEGDWMGETQTVFMVKKLDKKEVLAALREGRVYAVTGSSKSPKPTLNHFQIWDDKAQAWAEMGQTASIAKNTKIRISLSPVSQSQPGELKIIREGAVVKVVTVAAPYEAVLEFDYRKPGGKTYYRLDYNASLVSNPIFCDFSH